MQIARCERGSKKAGQNLIRLINSISNADHSGYCLEIHQLDVGQGESALIICKNGIDIEWSVLLDAGKNCNKNPDHIVNYIKGHIGENAKLDAVVISHDDEDHHCNLIQSLLDNKEHKIDIVVSYDRDQGTLFITQDWSSRFLLSEEKPTEVGKSKDLILNQNIWELLGKNMPKGKVPNMICIADSAKVRGKNGDKELTDFLSESKEDSKNERSLGFLIEFGGFKFYTAGDLPSKIEDNIDIGEVSAFKAGHHGSKFSTSSSLISVLRPRAAIISHGNKSFGEAHPNQSVLTNIAEDDLLQVAYLTNPATAEKEKEVFINSHRKFIIAGRRIVLNANNAHHKDEHSTRGDVFFRITQSQAEQEDVFFVDYGQNYKGKKNNRKDRRLVDHFTDVKKVGLKKITTKMLLDGREIQIESSHPISITNLKIEEGGRLIANLDNKASPALEVSGRYHKKGDEYKTEESQKEKTSNTDRLVLKSTGFTGVNFDNHRKFLKAYNPQGYDELIGSLPEGTRNQIELYKGQSKDLASKLKLKASNESDTSLSFSWIERVVDKDKKAKYTKHKIKFKTILESGIANGRGFVDRISYTTSDRCNSCNLI